MMLNHTYISFFELPTQTCEQQPLYLGHERDEGKEESME